MRAYTLAHVSDTELRRITPIVVAQERGVTVIVLLHIAEMDARKLYREEGFSSMHAYCVGKLHFSDDAAFTRILVARAARQFPILFLELESGRLHLTAVRLLAPHLTFENLGELIGAAVHRNKVDIERFLAQRFLETRAPAPRAVIRAIPSPPVELVLGQVESGMPLLEPLPETPEVPTPFPDPQVPSVPLAAAAPRPERFLIRVEVDKEIHNDLRAIQDLLGHAVASRDVAEVLRRALKHYRAHLQKKRFGAGRKQSRPTRSKRHIPAHVRNAVAERDGHQCTFVGTGDRRCQSRDRLEFDHLKPVSRGGDSTVENLRLRCRAHNQLEAERVFGAEFMQQKRTSRRASPSPFRSPHPPGPPPPACSSRGAGTPARAP